MASQDEYQQQQFFKDKPWAYYNQFIAEKEFREELERGCYKIDYTKEYIPIPPRDMTIGDDTLSKKLMTLDEIIEEYQLTEQQISDIKNLKTK